MPENSDLTELIADVREQVLYLKELGVATFDVNLAEPFENLAAPLPPRENISNFKSEISNLKSEMPKSVESRSSGSRLATLPSLSSLSKRNEPNSPPAIAAETSIVEKQTEILRAVSPALSDPTETIEQIRREIGPDCTRCKLSKLGRSQVVNSTGNFNAELMFVGEAPGADEDEQGFPFVGRAGKLLTDIMMAIGFNSR